MNARTWWSAGVIVLSLLALYLTTWMLDIRSTWLKSLEEKQTQLVQSGQELTKARNEVRLLEERLHAAKNLWGDVWAAPQSGPIGPGVIHLGVGGNTGLAMKEFAQKKALPPLYVFAAKAENASQYLGEFQIGQNGLSPNGADARLARPPHPGEVRSWPQGEYRVRESLPGSWRAIFADLQAEQLTAEAKLRMQQSELDILNNQIKVSQESLDRRLAELSGNPAALEGASQEVRDGLVQTLRNFEQQRNDLLKQVDQLRIAVDQKYVELRKTLAGNTEKLAQLTGSTASVPKQQSVVEAAR